MRAALLDASGKVRNLILLDKDREYTPDRGFTVVILSEGDFVDIGYFWRNGRWSSTIPGEAQPPTVNTPVKVSLEDQIAELRSVVEKLLIKSLGG